MAPPGGKRYWAAVEATLSLIQRTKTVGFSTRMPRDVFRSAVRYIFGWHHTHATLADRLHHRDKDLPDVLWVHEPETIPARMLGNMIVDAAASGRRLVLGIGSGSRPFRSAGSFLQRLRLNAGLQVVGLDCSGARELCRIAVQLGLDSRVRMTCDQRSINVTQAAELVVEKLRAGRTAVLVCAERREVEQADLVIRQRISEAAGVRPMVKLQLLRERVLGVADRCLSSSYRKGDIIIPQTNQFGFRAGEQLEVFGTSATAILVLTRKRRRPGLLQPGAMPRFAVFETFETELAVGDQVRITRRSKSLDGREMRSGDVLRIAGVDGNRNVRFEDGRCLARDFGHVAPFVACTPATLPRRVDCAFITSSALPVLAMRALSKLVRHDLVFTGSDEEALRKYLARSLPLRIRPTRWDPRPEPLVDAAPSAIAKSPSSVPAGAPLKTPTPPPKSFEVS